MQVWDISINFGMKQYSCFFYWTCSGIRYFHLIWQILVCFRITLCSTLQLDLCYVHITILCLFHGRLDLFLFWFFVCVLNVKLLQWKVINLAWKCNSVSSKCFLFVKTVMYGLISWRAIGNRELKRPALIVFENVFAKF